MRRRRVSAVPAPELPRRGVVLGGPLRRGSARDARLRRGFVRARDVRVGLHRVADDEPVREAGRKAGGEVRRESGVQRVGRELRLVDDQVDRAADVYIFYTARRSISAASRRTR